MRAALGFCLVVASAQCCAADVTVLSFRCDKTSWGAARLIGELTNTSGRKIGMVRVVATFRDAQGGLIESETGWGDIRPLLPSQTTAFHVTGPENPLYAKCQIVSISDGLGPALTVEMRPTPAPAVPQERKFYKCPDAAGTIVIQERPCG